jgi:membrane protein implicated in regulation of membrane protease activity
MSEPAPHQTRHNPITWAVITVLLLAALVGTLWVPFYARSTPKLGDFPFFYWYQLLWVPIVAVLSGVAYLLIRSGRPTTPGGSRSNSNDFSGDGEAS